MSQEAVVEITNVVEELSPLQVAFLAAYVESRGKVVAAARATGINGDTHYHWLKNSELYKRRFEHAKAQAAESLLNDAIQRASDGYLDPVFQGGILVGYRPVYSDSLMALLLKGAFPKVYGTERQQFSGDPDNPLLGKDPGRDALSDDALKTMRSIDDWAKSVRAAGKDPIAILSEVAAGSTEKKE